MSALEAIAENALSAITSLRQRCTKGTVSVLTGFIAMVAEKNATTGNVKKYKKNVFGRSNTVPTLCSARNGVARLNNQRRANAWAWHDKEDGLMWNMDAQVHQEDLLKCGLQ